MVARVTFKPSKQFEAQMRRDHDMIRFREARARDVLTTAIGIAPNDEGDYIAGLDVETDRTTGAVRVVATDYKSVWIEFGTGAPGPTKKRSVLRRAAMRNKLKFRGRRKRK